MYNKKNKDSKWAKTNKHSLALKFSIHKDMIVTIMNKATKVSKPPQKTSPLLQ